MKKDLTDLLKGTLAGLVASTAFVGCTPNYNSYNTEQTSPSHTSVPPRTTHTISPKRTMTSRFREAYGEERFDSLPNKQKTQIQVALESGHPEIPELLCLCYESPKETEAYIQRQGGIITQRTYDKADIQRINNSGEWVLRLDSNNPGDVATAKYIADPLNQTINNIAAQYFAEQVTPIIIESVE